MAEKIILKQNDCDDNDNLDSGFDLSPNLDRDNGDHVDNLIPEFKRLSISNDEKNEIEMDLNLPNPNVTLEPVVYTQLKPFESDKSKLDSAKSSPGSNSNSGKSKLDLTKSLESNLNSGKLKLELTKSSPQLSSNSGKSKVELTKSLESNLNSGKSKLELTKSSFGSNSNSGKSKLDSAKLSPETNFNCGKSEHNSAISSPGSNSNCGKLKLNSVKLSPESNSNCGKLKFNSAKSLELNGSSSSSSSSSSVEIDRQLLISSQKNHSKLPIIKAKRQLDKSKSLLPTQNPNISQITRFQLITNCPYLQYPSLHSVYSYLPLVTIPHVSLIPIVQMPFPVIANTFNQINCQLGNRSGYFGSWNSSIQSSMNSVQSISPSSEESRASSVPLQSLPKFSEESRAFSVPLQSLSKSSEESWASPIPLQSLSKFSEESRASSVPLQSLSKSSEESRASPVPSESFLAHRIINEPQKSSISSGFLLNSIEESSISSGSLLKPIQESPIPSGSLLNLIEESPIPSGSLSAEVSQTSPVPSESSSVIVEKFQSYRKSSLSIDELINLNLSEFSPISKISSSNDEKELSSQNSEILFPNLNDFQCLNESPEHLNSQSFHECPFGHSSILGSKSLYRLPRFVCIRYLVNGDCLNPLPPSSTESLNDLSLGCGYGLHLLFSEIGGGEKEFDDPKQFELRFQSSIQKLYGSNYNQINCSICSENVYEKHWKKQFYRYFDIDRIVKCLSNKIFGIFKNEPNCRHIFCWNCATIWQQDISPQCPVCHDD